MKKLVFLLGFCALFALPASADAHPRRWHYWGPYSYHWHRPYYMPYVQVHVGPYWTPYLGYGYRPYLNYYNYYGPRFGPYYSPSPRYPRYDYDYGPDGYGGSWRYHWR